LPWSLTDNGISWLEVTTKCNLACKGCYRDPKKEGHKTLDEIRDDLSVFKKHRKSDCMSIAGGDPLVHPQIVEIVKLISEGGWKPILNTNGLALTEKLLKELKVAGVAGFTFHIDTTQVRKDSKAVTEKDHNQLRQKFTDMVYKEGGMACSFNQTVSEKTLEQVPDTVAWAKANPHKVHSVVFILYREPSMSCHLNFYANGKIIEMDHAYNDTDFGGGRALVAQDVVNQIRLVDPDYEPAGYLNGTVDPKSMKWTLALRLATQDQTLGFAGGNFMKGVQHFSHFFRNKWLSYCSPAMLKTGRVSMAAFSVFDSGVWKATKNYLQFIGNNPLNILKPVYLQTYAIIQAVDFLGDGQINMCDGCPDITVYKGQLYWSCRLEEIKDHGSFLSAYPKAMCDSNDKMDLALSVN
jgi:organic radical activating enzyme